MNRLKVPVMACLVTLSTLLGAPGIAQEKATLCYQDCLYTLFPADAAAWYANFALGSSCLKRITTGDCDEPGCFPTCTCYVEDPEDNGPD